MSQSTGYSPQSLFHVFGSAPESRQGRRFPSSVRFRLERPLEQALEQRFTGSLFVCLENITRACSPCIFDPSWRRRDYDARASRA